MSIPIPVFGQWATAASYTGTAPPAWAGQPTKVAPSTTLLTPNTKPAAQNFNFLFNAIGASFQQQQNLVVSLAVGNFDRAITTIIPPGGSVSNAVLNAVSWNPSLQRWTGFFFNSATAWAMSTHDGGRDWEQVSPSSSTSLSCNGVIAGAALGNTDYFCYQGGGSTTGIAAVTFNGAISATVQPFLNALHAATMFAIPASPDIFLVGSEQSGGTMTGHMAASNTGTGLFTDLSTFLPATWQSATNHAAQYLNANNGSTQYLVGLCGAATTDTSRLMSITTGPPAFTDITPAFLTGKVLSGLAYGAQDNLWGVVCYDSTSVYLYTSPDLATWTLVHNFGATLSEVGAGGLAVVGAVWCVQITVTDAGSGTSDNDRLMISGDVGPLGASAAWTTAGYNLIDDTSGGLYPTAQILSNGNQLIAFNNAAHTFSKQVGFTPQGIY